MEKETLFTVVDKLLKKTAGSCLLEENPHAHPHGRKQCRAQVRIYIGQGQLGGSWVQCSKKARKDHHTCWWHKNIEES